MRKKRGKPHRRSIKTASILLLSFTIIAGCSETTPADPNAVAAVQQQTIKTVRVMSVVKQKIADPIERGAEVQSSIQIDIAARAGGDIEEIFKKRGDTVQKGDIILRLKSEEANFQRETAALAVKNIQDAIVKARERDKKEMESQKLEISNSIQKMELGLKDLLRNYNKMKNDYDVGLATKDELYKMESQMMNAQLDLDQMKQKQGTLEPIDSVSELETQLNSAQIALQQVEQSMLNLEVKAPVSGLLTEMPYEVGMPLQLGAKIGVLQKLDPIVIKGQITEEETKLVSDKKELTYYIPEVSEKTKGPISYLSKVIDPDTKAYELDLEVPNKEMSLKPGMKVVLQLTEEQDQIALTVPTYSIVKEGEDSFVFVLKDDSTVEKRKVQLGRVNEPNQEVLSGVKEGEQVVVSGQNELTDKEKVQTTVEASQ